MFPQAPQIGAFSSFCSAGFGAVGGSPFLLVRGVRASCVFGAGCFALIMSLTIRCPSGESRSKSRIILASGPMEFFGMIPLFVCRWRNRAPRRYPPSLYAPSPTTLNASSRNRSESPVVTVLGQCRWLRLFAAGPRFKRNRIPADCPPALARRDWIPA
jgi:hypothetical protein